MTNQNIPQHTYPQNLPVHFIGEFEDAQGEVVYICDWTYYKGKSIGYEISCDANGHVVGSYATGGDMTLTGHAESDTMTVTEMVTHITDMARQRLDAA